jgi:hypothetical protein
MPAMRDYAAAWRDSAALLVQVPVASLQAAGYLYQEWVDRSTTYLSHVTMRLALARPLAVRGRTSDKGVMATVLTQDLADETRTFVLKLIELPGETAKRFNVTLEDLARAVLDRVQPDAQTDLRTFVGNELAEIRQELNGLQEVVKADRAQRGAPGRAVRDPAVEPPSDIDGLLDALQTRIDAALRRFPTKPSALRRPDVRVQQQRTLGARLRVSKAKEEEKEASKELEAARAGGPKRRAGGKRNRRRYRPNRARKHVGG